MAAHASGTSTRDGSGCCACASRSRVRRLDARTGGGRGPGRLADELAMRAGQLTDRRRRVRFARSLRNAVESAALAAAGPARGAAIPVNRAAVLAARRRCWRSPTISSRRRIPNPLRRRAGRPAAARRRRAALPPVAAARSCTAPSSAPATRYDGAGTAQGLPRHGRRRRQDVPDAPGGPRRVEAGRDVVIGLLETHGREPRRRRAPTASRSSRAAASSYRDTRLEEMDLPAILAARAGALPDRRARAHERARASSTRKRYEDVEDVLAAGIDVFSTLNIQHSSRSTTSSPS